MIKKTGFTALGPQRCIQNEDRKHIACPGVIPVCL